MDVEFGAMSRRDSVEDTSILSSISKFLKDNVIDVLEDLTPVENRRPLPGRSSSCPRGACPSSNELKPSQSTAPRPLHDTTNLRQAAQSPFKAEKDDEWGWNDSPVASKALPRARGAGAKKKLLVTSKDKDQKIKFVPKPVAVMSTPPQDVKRDTAVTRDQGPPVKTPTSAEKGLLGAVVTGISVFGKQATEFLNTLDANFEQIFTGNEQQPATASATTSSSNSKSVSPEIVNPAPVAPETKSVASATHHNLGVGEEKNNKSVIRGQVANKIPATIQIPPPVENKVPTTIQIPPPVENKVPTTIQIPPPVENTATIYPDQKETSVVEAIMDNLGIKSSTQSLISSTAEPTLTTTAAVPAEKKKVQVKALMQEIASLRKEKEHLARELSEARQALPLSEDENLALMMRQVESLMGDKARLMAEKARLANENQGLHMLLAFTTEATNAAMGTPDRWRLHNEAISLLSPSPSQSAGSGSEQSSYYSYLLASAKKSPTIGSHLSHARLHCDLEAEVVKTREEAAAAVSRSLEFDDRADCTLREMAAVRQYYNLLFTQDGDSDEIDLLVDELVASIEDEGSFPRGTEASLDLSL